MSDIPEPNASSIPIADVQIHSTQNGAIQTESYEVKSVQTDVNDFFITVKKSLIIKIYKKLIKIKKTPFNWDELALLLFSSASSISITAAFAINTINQRWKPLLFTILPIIAGGSIIFMIMYKFYKFKIGKEDVESILEELKPINDAICEKENENGNE